MRAGKSGALALALLLAVCTAGGAGAQGEGHGKAKGHDKDVVSRGGVVVNEPGVPPGLDKRPGNLPPGLAKKPGGMPPGQYKKRYGTSEGADVLRDILVQRGYTVVRLTPAGRSQYVYYRLPDGTERRAIVRPGVERLTFVNVPAAIVQEVLARLY